MNTIALLIMNVQTVKLVNLIVLPETLAVTTTTTTIRRVLVTKSVYRSVSSFVFLFAFYTITFPKRIASNVVLTLILCL